MLKITKDHIIDIRNYFLTDNIGEQNIQNAEKDAELLSNFLLELKDILLSSAFNDAELLAFLKSNNAEEYLDEVKVIKIDYYSHLSALLNKTIFNTDINILVENRNKDFIEERAYQKDLQTAFILNERISLKNKFKKLDEEDIDAGEITTALQLLERKRLKEKFEQLDVIDNSSIDMVEEPTVSYNIKEQVNNEPLVKPAIVIKINWKHIAIAASVVGIICTTTLLFIKQNKTPTNIAINKPSIEKKDKDTLLIKKPTNVNELLASKLPVSETQTFVLNEASLGFAQKHEKIKINNYDVALKLDTLKKILANEIVGKGEGSLVTMVKKEINELNLLLNKYSFTNNTLTVYTNSQTPTNIVVYKIDEAYYFRINKNIYLASVNTKNEMLKNIKNADVLNKIKKIDFEKE